MEDTLWHIDWGDGDTNFVIAPSKEKAIAKMRDGKDMINFVVKLDHLYQLIYQAGIREVVKWTEREFGVDWSKEKEQLKKWGISKEG